ncbi:MAG TPA: hypothetical protein VGN44_20365 [Candidatus Angelobacter sp.]|jgi:uncharacterized protein (DUF697 family)
MSLSVQEKVHGVIHTAAASTAAVGAGLAQLPVADAIPITAIQVSMISAIALIHGRSISEATATSLLGTFAATVGGRTISQLLVGWIPGIGNMINASTAAGITEAVGWAANKYFENLGHEPGTGIPGVLFPEEAIRPNNLNDRDFVSTPDSSQFAQIQVFYSGRFVPLDVELDLLMDDQMMGSGSIRKGINLSFNIVPGIHRLELHRRSSNALVSKSLKLAALLKEEKCSLDLRMAGRYQVLISFNRLTGFCTFKLIKG